MIAVCAEGVGVLKRCGQTSSLKRLAGTTFKLPKLLPHHELINSFRLGLNLIGFHQQHQDVYA